MFKEKALHEKSAQGRKTEERRIKSDITGRLWQPTLSAGYAGM